MTRRLVTAVALMCLAAPVAVRGAQPRSPLDDAVRTLNDWDAPDNSYLGDSDSSLLYQEMLHAAHPQLVITHFLGPYTFTAPDISDERRAFLVEWHNGMRRARVCRIVARRHTYPGEKPCLICSV